MPIEPKRPSALRPVIFIAVVFGAVLALTAVSKWMAPPELVPWRGDLSAAQAESRASNRPVVLYFTAEWCGPCQEMRRRVWSEAAVADAMKSYIPVRLDVDREPTLAQQYQIQAMPTFLVLSPEGEVSRTQVGAMEAQEFINWLSRGS
jgi:thiol:disulfide interchange protein